MAHGPYDKIIISLANRKQLPPGVREQLREGGIIVATLREGNREYIYKFVKKDNRLRKERHKEIVHTPMSLIVENRKTDLHELFFHFQIGKRKCKLFESLKTE